MDAVSIVKKLGESDFSLHLNQIFEDMPKELNDELYEAQDRYMHLIGISSGSFSKKIIEQDRARFGDFVEISDRGKPIFCDDHCSEMMSALYGIPVLLCRMFVANDFNWTAASGFVDDENAVEKNNELLSNHLRDSDDLQEIIHFLMKREMLNKGSVPEKKNNENY